MKMSNAGDLPKQANPGEKYLRDLLLDGENPRFGADIESVDDQRKILDRIAENFAISDVLSSIASNGYFDSEPLVCQRADETGEKLIVKEGNRRLTACLIIERDERASNQDARIKQYRGLWEDKGRQKIQPVPVIIFPAGQSREIQSYLGVRHIASTRPWDSYAKAAWVAKTVEEIDLDIPDIAGMIGVSEGAITRQLEGYYLVHQLIKANRFDPKSSLRKGKGSASEYPFSWIYTILGYQDVRNYLGLEKEPPKKALLDKAKFDGGQLVLTAMLGDKNKGRDAAIDESRELGDLAKVFSSHEKIKLLEQGKKVREIERMTRPIKEQLEDGLGDSKEIMRGLISGLAEHGIAAQDAEHVKKSSSGNKKLAIDLHKRLEDYASGESEADDDGQ